MSCAETLQTACETVGLPVFPQVYTGKLKEYIVWNYTVIGAVFAHDVSHAARYLIQVHYYLPEKQNPNATLAALCIALEAAGCSCPDITPASGSYAEGMERYGQHFVLECEYADGGVDYGEG